LPAAGPQRSGSAAAGCGRLWCEPWPAGCPGRGRARPGRGLPRRGRPSRTAAATVPAPAIDPVGNGLAPAVFGEVMGPGSHRLTSGPPVPAGVPIRRHQGLRAVMVQAGSAGGDEIVQVVGIAGQAEEPVLFCDLLGWVPCSGQRPSSSSAGYRTARNPRSSGPRSVCGRGHPHRRRPARTAPPRFGAGGRGWCG